MDRGEGYVKGGRKALGCESNGGCKHRVDLLAPAASPRIPSAQSSPYVGFVRPIAPRGAFRAIAHTMLTTSQCFSIIELSLNDNRHAMSIHFIARLSPCELMEAPGRVI